MNRATTIATTVATTVPITAAAALALLLTSSSAAAQTRDNDTTWLDPILKNPTPTCPSRPLGTPEEDAHFGHAMAVGDFDGDGHVDLAVGAPREDGGPLFDNAGSVYLYRGFPSGDTWQDPGGGSHERVEFMPWQRLRRHDVSAQNAHANDLFGQALVSGDFNGDGYADLAIGVPGADSPLGSATGRVYVGWGSPTGLGDFDDVSPSVAGILPTGADYFGWALASGDLDDDDRDDLAIGGPGTINGGGIYAGHVRLMRGTNTGLVAWTGVHQEVVHNAVTPAGAGTGLPLGTHEQLDWFGGSLAIGDLDDDGREDLVVGAPGDKEGGPSSGAVYVFQSAAGGMRGWGRLDQTGLDSNESGDNFGHAVAIGNFKSGSPYNYEIIVGAPYEDIEAASIFDVGRIFSFENQGGTLTALSASYQTGVSDNTTGDMFGYSLLAYKIPSSYWMLLVSAPGDNRDGNTNAGEVLPFIPSETGPVDGGGGNPTEFTWLYGTQPQQFFGRSMAVGGPHNTIVIGHERDAGQSGGVWYKPFTDGAANLYQDSMNLPPYCQ